MSPRLYRRAFPSGARITTWRSRDGWPLRRFDWPAPEADATAGRATPRGSLLFQGGRGDIFEKYLEAFAGWHQQGWSITSFDWRGQGGSGRLTSAAQVGDVDDFATYVGDLNAFWTEWAPTCAGPRVLVGHSMGGHLVLRAIVENAVSPDAAVLVAPMLGLHSPLGARGEVLARLIAGLGDPGRPAWKTNERPGTTQTRQSLLTHDADRYADEIFWQTTRPDLLLGPPSWRWVVEAFASTRKLARDPRLGTVAVPLLLLAADADRLVATRSALDIAAKLPDVELVRFGAESAHEILREVDGVRDVALAEIDAFLAARVPV